MGENVLIFQYVNNCFREDSHHLFSMATVRRIKINQRHLKQKKKLSYALGTRFCLDIEPFHWQI